MRNRTRDCRGFTILELVIVGVIVGILAIIASSNLFLWLDHAGAIDFQREFLSRCNDARTRAMASNLQHRMMIDLEDETVVLQRGNTGTGSSVWTAIGTPVEGTRGAGIEEIVCDNVTVSASTFSFIFNPGGQVLTQDNSATIAPVSQARIHMTAANAEDRATIRVFGFTSKARRENGWN